MSLPTFVFVVRSSIRSLLGTNPVAPLTTSFTNFSITLFLSVQLSSLRFLILRRCTEETLPQRDVQTIYYIRTFPIKKHDLESMITKWEMANRHYDTVAHWQGHISAMVKEDNPMVYIRYVGMAEEGKTAFDRFKEDLKQRKSGILAAFLGELVNTYPDVLDASECHEIMGASYPKYPPTDDILVDDRERILIAAFNRTVLLNQQSGGFYPAYTPKASDQLLFTNLKTKFFDMFATNVDDRITSLGMRNQLDQWGENFLDMQQIIRWKP